MLKNEEFDELDINSDNRIKKLLKNDGFYRINCKLTH